MNGIVVREIAQDESLFVRELFETVFRDTFSDRVPIFESVTEGEQLYVALLNGCIVGMASVWEPNRFIHYLFVTQAARHKKVGSALVSRLSEIYGRPLMLKCLVKNVEGMAFYRATGWQEVETGISEDGAYALLSYNASNNRI